jgi:hypothetical protein
MPSSLKSLQIFSSGLKFSILAATSSALMILSIGRVSAVEDNLNYIGPSINFINGTTLYGVTSKFGVAENVSIRPFIQFASSGEGGLTIYGGSVNYGFNIPKSGLIPYVGFGYAVVNTTGVATGKSADYLEIGADYNATDNLALNAHYKTNGWVNIGAGYRF